MDDTDAAKKLKGSGQRYIVETPVEAHSPDVYRYDGYAQSLETLDSIGKEQIEFFHQQGYLAVRQAFGRRDIAAARQAIWDLIDGKPPDFGGVQVEAKVGEDYPGLSPEVRRNAVRKLFEFVDCDSRLRALAENSSVHEILTRILGERPVLFQDMALMKPPRVGREKPWHQDCAYFNLPVQATVVGVWIALDDATPENGCLHIIPRSHLEGPCPHFKKRDWQICDTDVPVHRDVMVPLPIGGCLIWHGLIYHGSPPNRSGMRRRALQYHYKGASVDEITVEERLAIYGGEGLGIEC